MSGENGHDTPSARSDVQARRPILVAEPSGAPSI